MATSAFVLIFFGCGLAILGLVCRAILFKARAITFDWRYYFVIGASFLGTVPATIGFYLLVQAPANTAKDADYSLILTVISLLATGVITAFFSFSYRNTIGDEVFLPTATSVSFVVLFYLTFAAISFYMGKSSVIHTVEGADVFAPLIMWMLLSANVMYDFLDYRKS